MWGMNEKADTLFKENKGANPFIAALFKIGEFIYDDFFWKC
jgi:hypothetical protein